MEEKGDTQSKSEKKKVNNLENLPINAKLQILNLLEQKSEYQGKNVGQVVPDEDLLPVVEFLPFLKDE